MKRIWSTPKHCAVSGATAVHSVKGPKLIRKIDFRPNTINADIGGGPYNTATKLLAMRGVENIIFDPVNRKSEHNAKAITALSCGQAATATVSNVLNVIPDRSCRRGVIRQAADAVGETGTAYFSVYEGSKLDKGEITKYGWQENRLAHSYLPEIEAVFSDVKLRRDGVIVAKKPKRRTCR